MVPIRLSVPAMCVCLLAGAVGGVFGAYRSARGIDATVVDWDRLRETTTLPGGTAVRPLHRYATVRLITPDWRPLIVRLDVVVPETAAPNLGVLRVEVDGWPLGALRPPPGRSTHELAVWQPAERREKLEVRLLHESGEAMAIAGLDVRPQIRKKGMLRAGLAGMVAGIALGAVWLLARLPPPPPSQARAATEAATGIGGRLALFVAVVAYLVPWAGIKPVLQVPDEPQHLLKANGVLRQPWLTAGAQFDQELRFVNPIALWTPAELDRVFFNGGATLSGSDLERLKREPWPRADPPRELEPYRVALASYPAPFYLATFGLSQPLIAASGATAYQAIFVYRLATLLLAAALWIAVDAELRRAPDLRRYRRLLLVFLLANPMLAFISSAMNADALAIPLCIGGAIAGWRLATTGEGSGRTFAWLTAAALVKPAGLQMIAAVAVAAGVTWYWWRNVHLGATVLTTARALATSAAAFYAWSYIHLYAGGPIRPGLAGYVGASLGSIGDTWVSYWGKLGWLDYSLPRVCYVLMVIPVAWALHAAWRRPALPRPAQIYFAICFVAFAATMYAVEYAYLHEAGYFIQGRYFLPASIGLAPLLFHHVRAARLTLVGAVLLLNVLLFNATVQRYYGGDWRLAWQALPLAAPSTTPADAAAATRMPRPSPQGAEPR
jgi:hypothetical protein